MSDTTINQFELLSSKVDKINETLVRLKQKTIKTEALSEQLVKHTKALNKANSLGERIEKVLKHIKFTLILLLFTELGQKYGAIVIKTLAGAI